MSKHPKRLWCRGCGEHHFEPECDGPFNPDSLAPADPVEREPVAIDGTIVGGSVKHAFHIQTNSKTFPPRVTLTNLERGTQAYVREGDGAREALERIEEKTQPKWGDHTPLREVLVSIGKIARAALTSQAPAQGKNND